MGGAAAAAAGGGCVVRKIFIVTPTNIGGGPEVEHQLAEAINRGGERAFMLYNREASERFSRRYEAPDCYRRYRTSPAVMGDVEPGSIVVLPEAAASMVSWWPGSDIYFWWLSVDIFTLMNPHPQAVITMMRPYVTRNLYQCEYIRRWLEGYGVTADRLADPLRWEYRVALDRPPGRECRMNLLVYSPTKGMERTQRILDELAGRSWAPEVVPITNMLPHQILRLLNHAKVAIDFGHHPGKDRLAREAAACGACVVVNRRGSAANPVDVPLPEEFKINDLTPGFERRAVDKIGELVNDFDRYQPMFDDYRKSIAEDSRAFFDDVAAVFPE